MYLIHFFSLKCKSLLQRKLIINLQFQLRGNGDLTFEESKSHFTAWAFMKSPLLIVSRDFSSLYSWFTPSICGRERKYVDTVQHNLLSLKTSCFSFQKRPSRLSISSKIMKSSLSIKTQSWAHPLPPLDGVSTWVFYSWYPCLVKRFYQPDWTHNWTHPAQYWSGESQNGTIFMLVSIRQSLEKGREPYQIVSQLNVLNEPADLFFSLTESPWIRAGRQYAVRVSAAANRWKSFTNQCRNQDLWSHTDNGTAVRNLTLHNVPPHGVVALLLKDAGDEPSGTQPPCARPEWCMGEDGRRADYWEYEEWFVHEQVRWLE